MDCFTSVDCNLDISLLSEVKQVSVDLTSLHIARHTIVHSNSFMIINREDILIWQNREEVFISLNEFQTIGCTKIRCKLLIETLHASVQVFYPSENSYLTIQYFITNICTTWQNAFICINFYEIKKQMSIYLFYHKNVRHVVSIECAKSQQNKLLMGMLITSRAITVIHVHDKSLKKLS